MSFQVSSAVQARRVPSGSIVPRTYLSLALLISGFGLGGLFNCVAYQSALPVMAAILTYVIVWLVLRLVCTEAERYSFALVFSVCWFWAGISALYFHYSNDVAQTQLDAASFYELASLGWPSSFDEWLLLVGTENGGAVAIWGGVYDLFQYLGFSPRYYIGIIVNICLVSLTVIVGMRMVVALFGNDQVRVRLFVALFSGCGLYWLFAAIHLRDAAILFLFSVLMLYWIRHLARPSTVTFFSLGIASVIAVPVLGSLRTEFFFIPIVLLVLGLMSVYSRQRPQGWMGYALLLSIAAVVGVSLFFLTGFIEGVLAALSLGKQTYDDLTSVQSDGGSLGNALVVNQVLPLRLLLGFIYLFIFPIPIWSGLQVQSVYPLLKSFHAIYVYAISPLLLMSVWNVLTKSRIRNPALIFLLMVGIVFTLGIAYSSLETRHHGPFLLSFLVLAVQPDLSKPGVAKCYWRVLYRVISLMLAVHVVWLGLKFWL